MKKAVDARKGVRLEDLDVDAPYQAQTPPGEIRAEERGVHAAIPVVCTLKVGMRMRMRMRTRMRMRMSMRVRMRMRMMMSCGF